jgi:hypothetical protein
MVLKIAFLVVADVVVVVVVELRHLMTNVI